MTDTWTNQAAFQMLHPVEFFGVHIIDQCRTHMSSSQVQRRVPTAHAHIPRTHVQRRIPTMHTHTCHIHMCSGAHPVPMPTHTCHLHMSGGTYPLHVYLCPLTRRLQPCLPWTFSLSLSHCQQGPLPFTPRSVSTCTVHGVKMHCSTAHDSCSLKWHAHFSGMLTSVAVKMHRSRAHASCSLQSSGMSVDTDPLA